MRNKKDAVNRINRSVYNVVVGSVKDSAMQVLSSAAQSKQLNIDKKELPKLLSLVAQAVESGYHRSNTVFTRELEDALDK